MTTDLRALATSLLKQAKDAGATDADVVIMQGDGMSIDVRNGALDNASRADAINIGLRTFKGKQQACVSSSDARPEALRIMTERAVAMATEAPEDPHCGLADADQLARNWDVAALELQDPAEMPAPDTLAELAHRAEAAAAVVKGISQVSETGASYSQNSIFLATSNGFEGGYATTGNALSCVAITGEGTSMERDYCFEWRAFAKDMPTPEKIGHLAAQRTVERAGSTKPPTGAYPVLYDERVANSLIGHLTAAINGTAIARGASWLKDAMGEQVLPASLSLHEDPTRPRVSNSRPFDAEGLPVSRRAIVENGVLTAWSLDLATARKLGLESTGSASRGTSSPPSPSTGNLTLTQGDTSREDLIAQMGTGLLITSLIGSTINANTGDYSRGASGFWIENGQISHPVNECTVAGNLHDMLKSLVAANDAQTHKSRVIPSLLVDSMIIAGG